MEVKGWRPIGKYHGQDPSLCETTDPVSVVDVTLYAKGSYRMAVNKGGKVVFRYRVNEELLRLPHQDEFVI